MKKIFFLGALLAFAMQNHAQTLKFGVKGGINYANMTGGDIAGYNDFKAITSYHLGILTEIKLTDNLAVQPELIYSTQGAEYENAVDDIKNELGYLAVPVLAKFYLNDGKTFSLEAGPQASFLVSERNEVELNDTNTFDFALVGGLEYKLTQNIFIQGRYNLGLTEAKKDADVKNSVIQLSAGFMF